MLKNIIQIEKSFNKAHKSKIFIYAYIKSTKAEPRKKFFGDLKKKDFHVVNIPSAFKLDKKINVQGPCIIIIHTSILNLKRFNYLLKLKDIFEFLSFKHVIKKKTLYYSSYLTFITLSSKSKFSYCTDLVYMLNLLSIRSLYLLHK